MKPQQLAEVITATSPNYDMPPVVTHNMNLSSADQQMLAGDIDMQAFEAAFGPAVQEPNIQVRVSFPASVYGKNQATGNYELQRVETARDLGAVALDKAGIAIASAESYMNVRDQGAIMSAQAAHIAQQQHEMWRQLDNLFPGELTPDGKKKKRKKSELELTA